MPSPRAKTMSPKAAGAMVGVSSTGATGRPSRARNRRTRFITNRTGAARTWAQAGGVAIMQNQEALARAKPRVMAAIGLSFLASAVAAPRNRVVVPASTGTKGRERPDFTRVQAEKRQRRQKQ